MKAGILKKCPFCGGEVYTVSGMVHEPRLAFKCKNPKCKAYMAFYNQDAMTSEHGSLTSYNRRFADEEEGF